MENFKNHSLNFYGFFESYYFGFGLGGLLPLAPPEGLPVELGGL